MMGANKQPDKINKIKQRTDCERDRARTLRIAIAAGPERSARQHQRNSKAP
jgi:hypothetical protein